MEIEKMTLCFYRNYESLNLIFSPKLNIFLGKNAQGKTNLLESIYVLSLARSHRSSNEKEMIQWNQEYARLEGKIKKKNSSINLTMLLTNKGKKTQINGLEQSKLSEYVGNLNVILFAPEDLSLVKGSPNMRRKFLDMEIGQINANYLFNLTNYQNILKQRNQYLKKMAYSGTTDFIYLDVLSEQLAKTGASIIFYRLNFIQKLEKWANTIHLNISDNKEFLTVKYKSQIELKDDMGEIDIFNILLKALKKTTNKDLKNLTTSLGPHRDDLLFFVNDKDIQKYGSQGQQRTTVLSLKLAEIELINDEIGEYPILLLDDVLSELDENRQIHLLKYIENNIQTFLTTTDLPDLEKKLNVKPEIFYISNGLVKGESD